jgi:hypothetical protein
MLLMALNQRVSIDSDEIELKFDNVRIKNIEFYSGKDVAVDYSDPNVTIGRVGNLISFSSTDNSKINLQLPESKTYRLILDDEGICTFDTEQVEFTTDDGELITIKEGTLFVTDDQENLQVVIDENGIVVDDDEEHVEINDSGILVEGDDNTNLTGFWGQLLGGFVRLVAKASINYVGKSPEKVVKYLVNEENGDRSISIDWGDETVELAEMEFQETFKPGKNEKLDISNLNGGIDVIGWDKKEVDVYAELKSRRGEKGFEDVELKVEHNKNWEIITEHLEKNPKVSVSYVIKVPLDMALNSIETTNGSIDIENVRGDINLRGSNGSIDIENVDGSIDAFTSNGRIAVENVTGKVNVTTSNGSINVENVDYLKNCITSNAGITARITEMHNDLLFSTSNASIKLYLDSSLDAEIIATTSNSSINVRDLNLNTKTISNSKFKGEMGSGKYKITASTSNARVSIYGME